MSKLPVHLLVDSLCRGSAESFDFAWAWADSFVKDLMSDPTCIEACHLTLWAFGDSARLVSSGQIENFKVPKVYPDGTKCALGHTPYIFPALETSPNFLSSLVTLPSMS